MTNPSTVTIKGQVTLPKRMRDMAGLKPGAKVDFVYVEGGIVVRKAGRREKSPFERFVGSAKGGLSTDEIMRLTRGEADE